MTWLTFVISAAGIEATSRCFFRIRHIFVSNALEKTCLCGGTEFLEKKYTTQIALLLCTTTFEHLCRRK